MTPAATVNPSGLSLPASPAARPDRPWWRGWVLGAFMLLFCGLQVGSSVWRSATYDEPMHLVAGHAALVNRDYRIDPTHPPLVRLWAALPLLGSAAGRPASGPIDALPPGAWIPQGYRYAQDVLFANEDADRLLGQARFMIVLLGCGLGWLVFRWVEEWLGLRAAAVVLLFYLLLPNLGAHAALVTTDLGVTALYFATIYFLWRLRRRFTAGNLAGVALAFAGAMTTKFSAVLLVPVGAVLLGHGVLRGDWSWRRAWLVVAVVAAVTWLAIWAVYGFRYLPSGTPGWRFDVAQEAVVREHLPVLAPMLGWIDAHRLLPNAYVQGFLMSQTSSELQPAYLLGDTYVGGLWYYFPVAFLVKTPVVLLGFTVAGVLLLVRRRVGAGVVMFVAVPAGAYFAVAMLTDINIGVRHILPVYPFVLLVAAVAVQRLLTGPGRPVWRYGLLGAGVALWVTTFTVRYPNTLSYFNLLAGGPSRGLDYLADSNLDWGQQLKRLRRWMDGRQLERINLAYFGAVDPRHYAVNAVLLPGARDFLAARVAKPELPGYVAIGATVLSGAYLAPEWRLFYGGFLRREPEAMIGHSMRVYWVEEWPEGSAADTGLEGDAAIEQHAVLAARLAGLGWAEAAVRHFEAYLRSRPGDARAQAAMGEELAGLRRWAEAREALARAVDLEPEVPAYRERLAGLLLRAGDYAGAVVQAEWLVQRQPGRASAYVRLGLALVGAGRRAEAEAAFRRALQVDPQERMARRQLDLLQAGR